MHKRNKGSVVVTSWLLASCSLVCWLIPVGWLVWQWQLFRRAVYESAICYSIFPNTINNAMAKGSVAIVGVVVVVVIERGATNASGKPDLCVWTSYLPVGLLYWLHAPLFI